MSGEGPLSCCPPRGEGQGAFWGPLHKSAVPIHEGHLLTFQRSHLRGQNSEQERRSGARAMLQIVTQGGDSAVFRRSWAAPRGTDLMQRARSAGPLSSLFQGSVLGWAVCEDTGGSASCGKDTFPCASPAFRSNSGKQTCLSTGKEQAKWLQARWVRNTTLQVSSGNASRLRLGLGHTDAKPQPHGEQGWVGVLGPAGSLSGQPWPYRDNCADCVTT